jgi:putative FmdB family regulatory protein
MAMPTYEYACEGCGPAFEEFQSMKSAVLKVCPVCKKRKLRRLIGAGAGVLFKGSGFYATDYRSSAYKTQAGADKAPSAPSSPPSAAKGDATPCPSKCDSCPKAKK